MSSPHLSQISYAESIWVRLLNVIIAFEHGWPDPLWVAAKE
jgi:hypothetical protein